MIQTIISTLRTLANEPIVTLISLGVILVLVILIILKEFVRTVDPPRARFWLHAFDMAIIPLVFAFGFIVLLRILGL